MLKTLKDNRDQLIGHIFVQFLKFQALATLMHIKLIKRPKTELTTVS